MTRPAALPRKHLADHCLDALAGLGGEASSPLIRRELESRGIITTRAYLWATLNALASQTDAPVRCAGRATGAPGRACRWRLTGTGLPTMVLDELLPIAVSRVAGRNVRALRVTAGLRQRDTAAAAGIAQSTLSFYERGYARIPVAAAEALARVLGTTAEVLTAAGGGP